MSLRLALKRSLEPESSSADDDPRKESQQQQQQQPKTTNQKNNNGSNKRQKKNSTKSAQSEKEDVAPSPAASFGLPKIPPPPKQKHPIGTLIERDFLDPATNKSRTYEASVERYEYVLQKKKWMYYVYYEDGEGEHLTESSVTRHRKKVITDPGQLYEHYFGHQWTKRTPARKINWDTFLNDLNRVPEIANIKAGDPDHFDLLARSPKIYPIQCALFCKDVPIKVIQRLIELNPESILVIEDRWRFDTFIAMMFSNRIQPYEINPAIWELLLSTSYSLNEYLDEYTARFRHNRVLVQNPVQWPHNAIDRLIDIYDNPDLEEGLEQHHLPNVLSLIEISFKYSPPAVAWVLTQHFTSKNVVSSEILTLALEAACDFEINPPEGCMSFFDENWFDTFCDYTSVWNDTVLNLDGSDGNNLNVFGLYVQMMAKSILLKRDKCYNDEYEGGRSRTDREVIRLKDFESSITSCVLYCLSEWETNLDHLWNTYVERCPTELLLRSTNNGSDDNTEESPSTPETAANPLHVAIRLGFQYDPVIHSLVETDRNNDDDEDNNNTTGLLLDSVDDIEQLPPCLLAASTPATKTWLRDSNLKGTSYTTESEYSELNHINNTYQLLVANPGSIFHTSSPTMDPHSLNNRMSAVADEPF